jgi:asparagine synthase (glutamine-hydrolysing)
MKSTIHREGYDELETHVDDHIAMGHLMLRVTPESIYDKQPLKSRCGRYLLAGHFRLDYRDELGDKLGLSQKELEIAPDSILVLMAYEKWGEKCLSRLRGMFAFAIADTVKKKIFIARDHFGIKPLYYYQSDGIIAFGSELQQFKELPGFDASIDLNAIDQYLWLQYIPAPLTVFKAIKKLQAAHFITIDFNGAISDQQKYWDLDFSKKQVKTEKQ